MTRPRLGIALTLVVVTLAGCGVSGGPGDVPPRPPAPPRIDFAGVPAEVRTYADRWSYILDDGTVIDVPQETSRTVTRFGASGPLVLIGRDAIGRFVASFSPQDGLPDGCYMTNDVGIERGVAIEIGGVLFIKDEEFVPSAVPPGMDRPYPSGTRFCFGEDGRVTSVVDG